MSTDKGKKTGPGIYFLPIAAAAPAVILMAAAAVKFGPMVKKLLGILVKLVVKA